MNSSVWINPELASVAMKEGTGRGIKIAVLDSGIELSHPAMMHRSLVDDIGFRVGPAGIVRRTVGRGVDVYGHGTAVAHGILRIAPEAQIGSFRILDENLGSKYPIVAEAARLAIDRGYNIINCSFGARARMDTIGHFKQWVDYAYSKGVHIVSACDNTYFRNAEWPGFFPSVIAVNMANTQSDDLYFRWDPAPGTVKHLVEFAARGVNLRVPWRKSTFRYQTGSSYAAPHVSGLLARMLSVHPGIKPPVAKALLQEVALPWDPDLKAPNN